MKNENHNQSENRFEMEELTNDTNSEAEQRITMVRTLRYLVVQTRESIVIHKFVSIADEFIRRLETVGGGHVSHSRAVASKYRWFSESGPQLCVYFLNQPKFGSIHF